MANLNLYDAARQFAEGANDMNDAATALRMRSTRETGNRHRNISASRHTSAC